MKLTELLARFKKGISFAISLVVIEHIAWIVEPAVFGKVIDALIERASAPVASSQLSLVPLFVSIGVFAINSGTGVVRRIFDQKIYLAMFTQLATEISTVAQQKKFRSSKTAALAQLSEQFITFFQYRLPEIIEQIIQIGGAVIALAVFDWRISLTCLTIVMPLLLISRIYTRRVGALQKDVHEYVRERIRCFFNTEAGRNPQLLYQICKHKTKYCELGCAQFWTDARDFIVHLSRGALHFHRSG